MKNWDLRSHILDHAETVHNNLPIDFNLKDEKNTHYTFSIDVSQLIINHQCNNQKDIDAVMNSFMSDLKAHSFEFTESHGKGRKPIVRSLDLTNTLVAYHNDASDSINSQNYSVNPHFHILIPSKLKNKDGKSTKLGKGYTHLNKLINQVAQKHNLVFNTNEQVQYSQDKFSKQGATSLTWFLKRADDDYFTKKVKDKSIIKAVNNFEKNYQKTGNMQYYLKGMRDLQERLIRLNLDLFNEDGVNLKDEYPISILEVHRKEIETLQSNNNQAIRKLLQNRDNRIARAMLEYSFGFDNIVIDELQSRGLYLPELDKNIVKDLTVHIEQKISKKDKYKKTLNYHIKKDIEKVLVDATNEKHFKELMQELGYLDINMKAKTVNGSRQRVGFTFVNPHAKKDTVVYFNSLNMNYSSFKKAFIDNSKKQKKRTEPYTYSDSYLYRYIPLNDDLELKKKQAFQNKVFKRIYQFDSSTDLTGFYIDESNRELKSKGTLIRDRGSKLTIAKQNSEDMQRNVQILLDMARAKGWDINNLCVQGTSEFKQAIKEEIQNINNRKFKKENENISSQSQEFDYSKNSLKDKNKSQQGHIR